MTKKARVTISCVCLEISSLEKAMSFYAPLFQSIGLRKVWGEESIAGFSNREFMIFIGVSKPRRSSGKSRPGGNPSLVITWPSGRRPALAQTRWARSSQKLAFVRSFRPRSSANSYPAAIPQASAVPRRSS